MSRRDLQALQVRLIVGRLCVTVGVGAKGLVLAPKGGSMGLSTLAVAVKRRGLELRTLALMHLLTHALTHSRAVELEVEGALDPDRPANSTPG